MIIKNAALIVFMLATIGFFLPHAGAEDLIAETPSMNAIMDPDQIQYLGVAVNDPQMTSWGGSPIRDDEGFYHLFVARWPSRLGVNPGWRSHSEIAHFRSQYPDKGFTYQQTSLAGTGQETWDKFAPHNPLIRKYGGTYALIYIARTDPKVNSSQRIGLATSPSLNGPWTRSTEPLLAPSADPENWTYHSSCGVNNPALLKMPDGRFFLYFKAMKNGVPGTRMGLAIADNLAGPYEIQSAPVTANEQSIEDGYAFLGPDKEVHLVTTDNHGILEKGGGLHWTSSDGIQFGKPELAYHRLDAYIDKSDYPSAQTIYGSGIWKIERPQILLEDGLPTYLYGPSGISTDGDPATECHVLRLH
ncbi:glycoside hydrolase family protein [Allorhodopirellula heiligendammensis]|uniref:Glycosyl hydrolases family 43 n=1 Tax=Allorhodopirellula heiligendammensis TaxID=2714739 RepID=A0A5C6BX68_9BACT|nr:glycoside hydrolase family protein [Allorhodopirellula heiligendammensis]TWU16873.1 Glycosyl hydrolases family 43 [Allorhodopirellula heiligendammensis]